MNLKRMAGKQPLKIAEGIVVRKNTSVDKKTDLKIAAGV